MSLVEKKALKNNLVVFKGLGVSVFCTKANHCKLKLTKKYKLRFQMSTEVDHHILTLITFMAAIISCLA